MIFVGCFPAIFYILIPLMPIIIFNKFFFVAICLKNIPQVSGLMSTAVLKIVSTIVVKDIWLSWFIAREVFC